VYKRQIYQIAESNRIEKIDSVARIESKLFFARIGMILLVSALAQRRRVSKNEFVLELYCLYLRSQVLTVSSGPARMLPAKFVLCCIIQCTN